MKITKKMWYNRKRFKIIIAALILLVVIRIALPYLVKYYVNNVLTDIPGYSGSVENIEIALFRGAYVINGLYLNKIDAGNQVPFLTGQRIDISVEWSSLFKGRIVSELIISEAELIYVFEDQKSNQSAKPDLEDWSEALTELVPIDINRLEIKDGKIAFVQLTAEPDIDLYINEIMLVATNLRNVVSEGEKLPSRISATALSIGQGEVSLEGELDLVKKVPDMDISFSLENVDVTALNDFTNHYAKLDFAEGNLNLYSELAIAEGYLTGYVKPLLKNSKLLGNKDGFLATLWEGFVGFFKFLLKNQANDTLGTEMPIEGNLNEVEGKIWRTVFNLVKNGWIKAFTNNTDDKVEFKDAVEAKNTQ